MAMRVNRKIEWFRIQKFNDECQWSGVNLMQMSVPCRVFCSIEVIVHRSRATLTSIQYQIPKSTAIGRRYFSKAHLVDQTAPEDLCWPLADRSIPARSRALLL